MIRPLYPTSYPTEPLPAPLELQSLLLRSHLTLDAWTIFRKKNWKRFSVLTASMLRLFEWFCDCVRRQVSNLQCTGFAALWCGGHGNKCANLLSTNNAVVPWHQHCYREKSILWKSNGNTERERESKERWLQPSVTSDSSTRSSSRLPIVLPAV